jgi:PAS domain-containing protein
MDSFSSLDWVMPQVIQLAGVGYSVQTVTQQKIQWSPALEQFYGLEPGTFAGSFAAFIQLVYEDDRDYVRHECWRAIAQQADYSFTCRTADNPRVWMEHRGRLVFEGQQLIQVVEVVTNVTDFQRVQQTLLDSNLWQDTLLEHSDCLVLKVSEEGTIDDALPCRQSPLGVASAALLGRNLGEFIALSDQLKWQQAWQVWRAGEALSIRLCNLYGGMVEATGEYVAIDSQRPGVIMTLRDDSAAFAAEQQVQTQVQQLQTLMTQPGAAVFRCLPNRERSLELGCEAIAAISQYPVTEFLRGRGLMSLCHAEDQALMQATLRQAIAALEAYHVDYRWVTAAGEVRWVAEQGRPVVDEQGWVVAIEGWIWDISDRYAEQERLQQDRSLLATILESTADGILAIDRNQKVTHFNQKFLTIWSLTEEFITHSSDWQLVTFMMGQLSNPDAFWEQVRQESFHPDLDGHGWVEFKDGKRFERYSFPQWYEGKIVGRVISYRENLSAPVILN